MEPCLRDGDGFGLMDLVLPEVWVTWHWLTFREKDLFPIRDRVRGDTCHLLFCLDGSLKAQALKSGPTAHLNVSVGSCAFIYCPGNCLCTDCHALTRGRAFQIRFSRNNLLYLMDHHGLGDELRRAEQYGHPFAVVTKITPTMEYILRQLDDKADQGDGAALLGMAKAMELLWLFARACDQPGRARINGLDCRAIQKAQAVLEAKMADPPSLAELSSRVGMSLSKFKRVFPAVAGMTPFGYLRRIRMERALFLMQMNDANVTEAALEVGYSSLSQFTRAFTRQFGFKPSKVCRLA